MLRNFLFLLSIFTISAKRNWRNLDNYNFDNFLEEFQINLEKNSPEYEKRKNLFDLELKRVVSLNNEQKSWKETINSRSLLTKEEQKKFYGYNKSSKKSFSAKNSNFHAPLTSSAFTMRPISELPTDVDWRNEHVVSAVKDQGYCGSCWAFAATATIESHVAIASGELFDLSPQQIAACSPNPNHCGGSGNCQGATAEIAFDYVAGSQGLMQEFQYGYTEYFATESSCAVPTGTTPKAKISGYTKLSENNYEELLNAVAQLGPIAVSVDASNWGAYAGGIFDGCNQAQPDIDHAVVLVGYGVDNGQKYWLIRNSWSASWGENGYIRLARSDSEDTKCGTDTTPQDGSACEGQTQPVTVCGTCGVLYDSSYPTGANIV